MLITIVSTVIVLGILIFVHELGHFLLCKRMGVKVLKFSLGFGPRLIGKKVGETEYQIAVFPLGGFVKPLGEDPNEEVNTEEYSRSFWAQRVWKRALIIGAGPFFNFFLGSIYYVTSEEMFEGKLEKRLKERQSKLDQAQEKIRNYTLFQNEVLSISR